MRPSKSSGRLWRPLLRQKRVGTDSWNRKIMQSKMGGGGGRGGRGGAVVPDTELETFSARRCPESRRTFGVTFWDKCLLVEHEICGSRYR